MTLVFLIGCAATKRLSIENRERIQTIMISKEISEPDQPIYLGPGQAFGAAVGGVVGSLIADAGSDAPTIIHNYVQENNIDLRLIVSRALSQELKDSDIFQITDTGSSDGTILLEIKSYGFQKGWGIKVKPVLVVSGRLVGVNGAVLWEKTEGVSGISGGTPEKHLEDWLSDPVSFRKAFEKAAHLIAGAFIAHMVEK